MSSKKVKAGETDDTVIDCTSLGTDTAPPPPTSASSQSATSTPQSPSSTDAPKKESSGGFLEMMTGVISAVPFKMAILLYIVFVLVNSTIFIEYCIEPLGKSYHDGTLTNTGTYLQGLFLVIGYMIMHALVVTEII